MKKLYLFGIQRNEKRAHIIIQKSQTFVSLIRKVIKEITGIDLDYQLFMTEDENGDMVDEKIENWTDRCLDLTFKDCDLDIFIGKDRIIIVIRSSVKNQQKFIDTIMNFYQWKE